MEILFMLIAFGIFLIAVSAAPAAPAKMQDGKVIKVTTIKKCPPHRWKWVDMVDQDGIKQGEQLICQDCGPLASQSGRD